MYVVLKLAAVGHAQLISLLGQDRGAPWSLGPFYTVLGLLASHSSAHSTANPREMPIYSLRWQH